jgi:hypothetical protein
MIDLYADDAAKISAFHSLWVGKAGDELLRSSPPLAGASVLSASRLEPLCNPLATVGVRRIMVELAAVRIWLRAIESTT